MLVPRVDNKNKNNNKNNIYGQDIASTSSYMKSSIYLFISGVSFLKIQRLTAMSRPVPSRPKLAQIMGIKGAF